MSFTFLHSDSLATTPGLRLGDEYISQQSTLPDSVWPLFCFSVNNLQSCRRLLASQILVAAVVDGGQVGTVDGGR